MQRLIEMARKISLDEYKKAYRRATIEEKKRGFFIHLTVYVLVNALLVAVNLVYSPKHLWFFYVLLGWGIGILMHYLNGVRRMETHLKEKEAKAERLAKERKR